MQIERGWCSFGRAMASGFLGGWLNQIDGASAWATCVGKRASRLPAFTPLLLGSKAFIRCAAFGSDVADWAVGRFVSPSTLPSCTFGDTFDPKEQRQCPTSLAYCLQSKSAIPPPPSSSYALRDEVQLTREHVMSQKLKSPETIFDKAIAIEPS